MLWIHPLEFVDFIYLISYEADGTDGGRDIANFLLYFLPSVTTATLLPVHLQQVSAEETSLRIRRGFIYRKFVAVAHSYGGCISYALNPSFTPPKKQKKLTCGFRSLAASLYPNLFHSLVLIDPVIDQPQNLSDMKLRASSFVQAALNRRDTWSSRRVDTSSHPSFLIIINK